MSYTKTQWNNDTAPAINEDNLNKIEQGIYDNDSHIGDLSDLETTANTDLVSAINENVSSIGDLSDLETTVQTDIVSAVNENVDNIGDLTTLTTTANADLVSAINELESEKLDATGTAVNSTKWNNLERDTGTNNDVDTWLMVLKDNKVQHTTISSVVNRGKLASYNMSANVGWKRIARLEGVAGGNLTIRNTLGQHGSIGNISLATTIGWTQSLTKNYKVHVNNNYFTKLRLITKGNADTYLEIYQNIAESKLVELLLSSDSMGIVLYTSETAGGVPSGYIETQYNYE